MRTVMSWQPRVAVAAPSPWMGALVRASILPVAGSEKMRGEFTTLASSGWATGTLMTTMVKRAVSGSSPGAAPEQPASSSFWRTPADPET